MIVIPKNVQFNSFYSVLKSKKAVLCVMHHITQLFYFIENDTVKLIFYKGTETRIQIPSEIEGKPVTEIESTCFTNSNVKYAVIPETVEKIY